MSLPYRQQRRLRRIGHALRQSDPELAAKLSIFAQVGAAEELPGWEQLPTSRKPIWRVLRWPVKTAVFLLVSPRAAGRSRRGVQRQAALRLPNPATSPV
jgi:hypothetical protein